MVIFKCYFSAQINEKKKKYSNKQLKLMQQTALSKQALYAALYTTALK